MTWREWLLLAIAGATIVAVAFADPIPQDVAYHLFSDDRRIGGLPNFLNVASNLPFLFVGIAGVRFIQRQYTSSELLMRPAWLVFFVAVAMTSIGSGYYHVDPNNSSLVWDRLPMTLAFMSLVAIVVAEYKSPRIAARLLGGLLLLGVASVIYWAFTEAQGRGDLRPYVLVQFLPMILIPLVLALYPRRSELAPYLWGMIGLYIAAKLAEHFDGQILAAGSVISGHSIKHLIASLAPAYVLLGLKRRAESKR